MLVQLIRGICCFFALCLSALQISQNILLMNNFLWPSSLLLVLDLSKGLSISDALAGSSSKSNYSFVMNFSRKSKFGGMDSKDTLFLSYSSRSYSPLILK